MVYSALGGLLGVLLTDFFQFFIAMAGSISAAIVAINLPQVGGLSKLLSHEFVMPKLNMLPDFSNAEALVALFVLPLAVQWWSVWYPGAEPGGGGYIAQRMLSAKTEKHAMGATLFFNAAHYALRPWPWILVALASLIVFPNLDALRSAFPHVSPGVIRHDMAYPAMLTFLPHGLLGMVVASLIAAFMSTIATHLNWGSSYIVNDFYKRFINPKASDKKQVLIGRLSTAGLMVLTGIVALLLSNALQAFNILLQIGAGTGLLFILRWFWWRINPYSELTAMIVSFLVAVYLQLIHPHTGLAQISTHIQLVMGVGITTVAWIAVTLLTQPSDKKKLRSFYSHIRPGGPGWKSVIDLANQENDPIQETERDWDVPTGILCMVLGCFAVYAALFATGNWIYGKNLLAGILTAVAILATVILIRLWGKLRVQ
jgi:SSS family solute:Na+ symporter